MKYVKLFSAWASGFESAWRMKEFTDEKNIPFWEINREGESYTID